MGWLHISKGGNVNIKFDESSCGMIKYKASWSLISKKGGKNNQQVDGDEVIIIALPLF